MVEKKPSKMFAGNVDNLILSYALLPSSGLLHGGLTEQNKALTWRVFLRSPAKCVVGWQTYKVFFLFSAVTDAWINPVAETVTFHFTDKNEAPSDCCLAGW